MKIETAANFSFPQTVVSPGWYHLAPFRWDAVMKTLHRVELLSGQPVALTITRKRGAIEVTGAKDSKELRAKLARMFQLDLDLSDFLARTRLSPAHAWVEPAGFVRLLCKPTLFEDVVKIITEFRRFVRERYHSGRKVADATMLRRYAKWGCWKYLAYWSELWESEAAGLQPPDKDK